MDRSFLVSDALRELSAPSDAVVLPTVRHLRMYLVTSFSAVIPASFDTRTRNEKLNFSSQKIFRRASHKRISAIYVSGRDDV